jgi:CHAD domain-containing protein/HD superfamily phosphodiesterase
VNFWKEQLCSRRSKSAFALQPVSSVEYAGVGQSPTIRLKTAAKTTGLRYWMLQVLEECDHVAANFSADPVHDLRVALRRCRSLADGMIAMDPDPGWKAMKKAGKALFQRLGALRDVQVMMEWVDKLHSLPVQGAVHKELSGSAIADSGQANDGNAQEVHGQSADHPPHDPVTHALLAILNHRETEHKHEARAALEEFDRKQWRQWAKSLPHRAARIRPGSAVFKHLALERWTAARDLHTTALRNRSQVAFHTLRIGIKRFRYIVENFLPAEHKAWSNDLKHMQDLLGEVHDLDVLWATALSCHVFPDVASRKAWHARILEERTERIDEYRSKTVGPESLWNTWRAGLPQDKQIRDLATRRMKLWAKVLDPDFAHSERVARLALELYDELDARGLLSSQHQNGENSHPSKSVKGEAPAANGASGARASLYAAALLHDVGKARGDKGHHKESLELIKKHGTPLGWKDEDMQRAAIVARFHCGALPTRSHKKLRDLLPDEQKATIQLAAILRLANALDSEHDGHIRRVQIENPNGRSKMDRTKLDRTKTGRTNGFLRKPPALGKNEAVVISAEGYIPNSPTAQSVAAERYLLENVLRRPVIVKAAKPVTG